MSDSTCLVVRQCRQNGRPVPRPPCPVPRWRRRRWTRPQTLLPLPLPLTLERGLLGPLLVRFGLCFCRSIWVPIPFVCVITCMPSPQGGFLSRRVFFPLPSRRAANSQRSTRHRRGGRGDHCLGRAGVGALRHVIIEASKECGCFKVRSGKLEKVLTAGRPDIVVTVNAEKPRKGCFEVEFPHRGYAIASLLQKISLSKKPGRELLESVVLPTFQK